ncbi:MAG: hypothetical protein IJ202_11110 [Bacteroidales bacterium]|nr:hypothetical protein [Bacteroidales bacterium]
MKFRNIAFFSALAVMLIIPSSCKKDKKTEYSESFSGSLRFNAPLFASPGETYELVPGGVHTEDGTPWGYIWTATPYQTERDTTRYDSDPSSVTGAFTLKIPTDTLCTMTVTCYSYAKGYYNSSKSTSVVIVDPEKSLTNMTEADLPVFTDPRDGKEYGYTKIGSYEWFTSNLAYEGSGSSFEDCDAMMPIYGRYYTYEEAIKACPDGWTLPSYETWKSIAGNLGGGSDDTGAITGIAGDLMVDAYFNGVRLWEYWPDVKVTNKTLFYSLPSGYAIVSAKGRTYQGEGDYAAYWTSDIMDEDDAYYMYIYLKQPDVLKGSGDRNYFAAPVRCVRKAE